MKPTEPLLRFLYGFPPPAAAAELWIDIATIRQFVSSDAADGLPDTHAELEAMLQSLAEAGKVECVDGQWKPLAARREKQEQERMLFV